MPASGICRSGGTVHRDEQADLAYPRHRKMAGPSRARTGAPRGGPCRYTSACRGRWAARCRGRGRQGQAVHALCRTEGVWRARRERRARRRVGSVGRGGRRMRTRPESGIPGSASLQWREPVRRRKSLAVPELGGEDAPDAGKPWQCQSWVARTSRMPGIPGTARTGWRGRPGCQESLALPELGGEGPPRARNPWQCQR